MPELPQTYHDLLDLLPEYGRTAMDRRRTRRLLAARAALAEAEAELVAAVQEAYDGGDSWRTIGTALGMTRQAAQQRFGRRGKHRGKHRAAPAPGPSVERVETTDELTSSMRVRSERLELSLDGT